MTKKIFHPSPLLLFLDPESGVIIPDPQHCFLSMFITPAFLGAKKLGLLAVCTRTSLFSFQARN
jgi:hypothetical protein